MSAEGKNSAKLSPRFSRGSNAGLSNQGYAAHRKILRSPRGHYITILKILHIRNNEQALGIVTSEKASLTSEPGLNTNTYTP